MSQFYAPTVLLKSTVKFFTHLLLTFPNISFPRRFSTKILLALVIYIHSTRSVHSFLYYKMS